MMKTFVLLAVLAVSLCDQPNYIANLDILGQDKEIALTVFPYSDQSRILNIKHNEVELRLISDEQACNGIEPIERKEDAAPIIYLVDFSVTPPTTCPIYKKLHQVRMAGAGGLILVTEHPQTTGSKCSMSKGMPLFFGYMTPDNYTLISESIPVEAVLTIELRDRDVELFEVWTSALSPDSYEAVAMAGKVLGNLTTLPDRVQFAPRIASLGCVYSRGYQVCKEAQYVASCACGGLFCSPEYHGKTPQVLIRQDIRQWQIFRQYRSRYFAYMDCFSQNCLPKNNIREWSVEDCANSMMTKNGIDSVSINKQVDTFMDSCADKDSPQHSSELYQKLSNDKFSFINYGRYPLILLNRQILDYETQADLQGILCNELNLNDAACEIKVADTHDVTTSVSWVFWVLLVVALLATAVAVGLLLRKRIKRDMDKEVKMQVSTAVDHYFALSDKSVTQAK